MAAARTGQRGLSRSPGCYTVTSTRTGQTLTLGRGHLKKVTGWTLTAAQAAREVAMIARRAEWDANWAAFTGTHPAEAAALDADCDAYTEMYPPSRGYPGGASHEVRQAVREGSPNAAHMVTEYMTRRHTYAWSAK